MSGGVGSALNGTALDRALAAVNAANVALVEIERLVSEASDRAAAGAADGVSQYANELMGSVAALSGSLGQAISNFEATREQADAALAATEKRLRFDDAQEITNEQRAQVMANLGLGEIATMSRSEIVAAVIEAISAKEF